MSSPATSSVSCSCFVRVTIMVRAMFVSNERRSETHRRLDFTTFQTDLWFAVDFQNYLRTQIGSTTTINIIICTVDYLLRLQVQLLI